MVPPLAATSLSGLCLARAAVGLGEAVAPSAATDLVARAVPAAERSRAVTFIFGGHQVGSIVGLLAAPPLIETAGWQCVFYSFGALGAVWWLWWQVSLLPHAMKEEGISSAGAAETVTGAWAADATPPSSAAGKAARRQQAPLAPGPATLPFRAFLRNRSVQVLMATHFCHNWLHYCMLAWLPSYFTSTMGADLSHAAHTALLPPLAGIAASAVAGSTADALLQRGVPVTAVRKGAQGVSFLGSAAGLLAAAHCSHGGDATAAVACISAAQAMSSVSLAGLHCSHQDLSPKYAGTLLGITNTAGALPGVVGVAAVGALLEVTNGSWEEAFFYPSAALLLLGAAVFTLYVNNEPVNFDAKGADAPFAWEGGMQRLAVSALTMPRKLRRALR